MPGWLKAALSISGSPPPQELEISVRAERHAVSLGGFEVCVGCRRVGLDEHDRQFWQTAWAISMSVESQAPIPRLLTCCRLLLFFTCPFLQTAFRLSCRFLVGNGGCGFPLWLTFSKQLLSLRWCIG